MSLDVTKIGIIVNQCTETMVQASQQGYTFDSVELLPWQGAPWGNDDGVSYNLWVRNAQGEKSLARTEHIPLTMNTPVPKEDALASVKTIQDEVDSGTYNMDSPNYWGKS